MMQLPNLLTVFRLIAAPMVLLVFLILPRPYAEIASLSLFILAAITDYLDGYLARRWQQTSALGKMLDPIADKAMVLIALLLLLGLFGLNWWIALPATIIVFREIMVAGIREHLGQAAGQLSVTQLAKWKTAVQLVAIIVLLSHGIFQHYFVIRTIGMDASILREILAGEVEDLFNLRFRYHAMLGSLYGGVVLFWIAALLTAITGWDYFRKSLPLLKQSQ